jgi:putative acyl-CoA dehydrogenase
VEESIMPRLYRETPLNSVWEGAGNVICLDVLRAITKEPRSLEAVVDEIRLARGANKRLDAYACALEKEFQSGIQESGARRLAQGIALALQGSLVVRFASAAVSDAFCASRLERNAPVFGTLGPDADLDGILVG